MSPKVHDSANIIVQVPPKVTLTQGTLHRFPTEAVKAPRAGSLSS